MKSSPPSGTTGWKTGRLDCGKPSPSGPVAAVAAPPHLVGPARLDPSKKSEGKDPAGKGTKSLAVTSPTKDQSAREDRYRAEAAVLRAKISDREALRVALEKVKPAILYGP